MMRIRTEETRRVNAQEALSPLCWGGCGMATVEEFGRPKRSHPWRRAAPFQTQG
jgi:hypothetical protein